jgi:hypothetical protein
MPSVAFRADVVPVGQVSISTALSCTIDAQQTSVREFVLELLPLDHQSGPIAQSRYT